MGKFKILLSLFVILPALVQLPAAHALELAGVILPERKVVSEQKLILNGAGIRKATIFRVKVYVMGMYLKEKSSDPNTIINSPDPKHMRLEFVRSVEAYKLKDAWVEGFEKNAPEVKDHPLLAKFNNYMQDVDEGSTIELSFLDGSTVDLILNGEKVDTFKDKGFAQGLLKIWFGPEPPNEDLKTGLLGK